MVVGWRRLPPTGALAVGAASTFTAAALCGRHHVLLGLVVLSVLVAGASGLSAAPVGLAVAGIAWFFLTGFVADGYGVIRFDAADDVRLLPLAGAALAGWAAGLVLTAVHRRLHSIPADYPDPDPAFICRRPD